MEPIIPFESVDAAQTFFEKNRKLLVSRRKESNQAGELEIPPMDQFQGAVDMAALAAASIAQGIQDVRYYINGVYLAPQDKGEQSGALVATNGHTMHWIGKAQVIKGLKSGGDLVLRYANGGKGHKKFPTTIASAPKSGSNGPLGEEFSRNLGFLFLDEDVRRGVLIDLNGKEWKVEYVWCDGSYPDYLHVLPDQIQPALPTGTKGSQNSFNAIYMMEACQGAKLLMGRCKYAPAIELWSCKSRHGAKSELLILKWCGHGKMRGTSAFGLVMAMRN